MNELTKRDLKASMVVAPLLAVLGYVAADRAVAEVPHAADRGRSYRLAAMSNCRYQSGGCTLRNGEVELKLESRRTAKGVVELLLSSPLPIQNALLAYSGGGGYSEPLRMKAEYDGSERLAAQMILRETQDSRLRLAVTINGSNFYVETTAIFVDRVTAFSKASQATES